MNDKHINFIDIINRSCKMEDAMLLDTALITVCICEHKCMHAIFMLVYICIIKILVLMLTVRMINSHFMRSSRSHVFQKMLGDGIYAIRDGPLSTEVIQMEEFTCYYKLK